MPVLSCADVCLCAYCLICKHKALCEILQHHFIPGETEAERSGLTPEFVIHQGLHDSLLSDLAPLRETVGRSWEVGIAAVR